MFLKLNWSWICEIAKAAGIAKIPKNAPSQSTLSRFYSGSDEFAIKQLYLKELRTQIGPVADEKTPQEIQSPSLLGQVCVDGKRREGCISLATGRTEIDLSFFDPLTRNVLATHVCPDKEGEAVTATKMMTMIGGSLQPSIFTFDAGITGPRFISSLTAKRHHYIGAIKGNAGAVFDTILKANWLVSKMTYTSDWESAHGRQEQRTIRVLRTTAFPPKTFSKYSKCGSVIQVTRHCLEKGKETVEVRYFIASTGLGKLTPQELLERVRNHWIIENGLHWVKDVALREDNRPKQSRKGSRLLGFFSSLVVSIGYSIEKSVQRFIDMFSAAPSEISKRLFKG